MWSGSIGFRGMSNFISVSMYKFNASFFREAEFNLKAFRFSYKGKKEKIGLMHDLATRCRPVFITLFCLFSYPSNTFCGV